jgi:hypothetical protein
LDSARAVGLPVEPLEAKIDEGLLKGADDAPIVNAVRGLAMRLTEARRVLGATASTGDMVAASSALFAGLTPAQVGRLRDARATAGETPRGSLAAALVAAADLAARGVPRGAAVDALASLLTRNAGDELLFRFSAEVDREIGRGTSPLQATETTLRTIRPG